jgi:hypothetical protein
MEERSAWRGNTSIAHGNLLLFCQLDIYYLVYCGLDKDPGFPIEVAPGKSYHPK